MCPDERTTGYYTKHNPPRPMVVIHSDHAQIIEQNLNKLFSQLNIKSSLTQKEKEKFERNLSQIACKLEKYYNANYSKGKSFQNLSDAKKSTSPFDFSARIKKTADLLGISPQKYLKALILKGDAETLASSPEKINSNVNETVRILWDIPLNEDAVFESPSFKQKKTIYVHRILKTNTTLLRNAPETLKKKIRFLKSARKAGFISTEDSSLHEAILKHPTSLTYAADNTLLRIIHANITEKKYTLSSFFTGKGNHRPEIESNIVSAYTRRFKEAAEKGNVLKMISSGQPIRAMHKNGIISTLPQWAVFPEIS